MNFFITDLFLPHSPHGGRHEFTPFAPASMKIASLRCTR